MQQCLVPARGCGCCRDAHTSEHACRVRGLGVKKVVNQPSRDVLHQLLPVWLFPLFFQNRFALGGGASLLTATWQVNQCIRAISGAVEGSKDLSSPCCFRQCFRLQPELQLRMFIDCYFGLLLAAQGVNSNVLNKQAEIWQGRSWQAVIKQLSDLKEDKKQMTVYTCMTANRPGEKTTSLQEGGRSFSYSCSCLMIKLLSWRLPEGGTNPNMF